jgi:hypothetical protein
VRFYRKDQTILYRESSLGSAPDLLSVRPRDEERLKLTRAVARMLHTLTSRESLVVLQ